MDNLAAGFGMAGGTWETLGVLGLPFSAKLPFSSKILAICGDTNWRLLPVLADCCTLA